MSEWGASFDFTPAYDIARVPAVSRSMLTAEAFAAAGATQLQRVANTTSFPGSSVAQLIVTLVDGHTLASATGSFIAQNVILTAAHAIFVPGFGPLAGHIRDMVVVPGRNGDSVAPFGADHALRFYVPDMWLQHQLPDFDYALAFTPPVNVQPFLPVAATDAQLHNLPVRVTGYPIDKPLGTQWTAARTIAAASQGQVAYNIDTEVGMSGAGVIHHTNGGGVVVAIHRFEDERASFGTRITPAVLNDIRAHMPV